jgi:hypothetical protein
MFSCIFSTLLRPTTYVKRWDNDFRYRHHRNALRGIRLARTSSWEIIHPTIEDYITLTSIISTNNRTPHFLHRRFIDNVQKVALRVCITQAIVELAADSRQVSSRYSGRCAAISNAEDGVRSANPKNFTF